MRKSTDTSRIALGDLNHYWTIEDEREFIRLKDEMSAEELAAHFNRDIYEVIVEGLHIRRQQERLEELEREEGVTYDKASRMNYHPSYHDRQGEEWTVEEIQYLCTWHDLDGLNKVALALGRTPKTLSSQLGNVRKLGMYHHYRKREEIV
jgi:aspartyl/asparaginyl-tRNA synthetase